MLFEDIRGDLSKSIVAQMLDGREYLIQIHLCSFGMGMTIRRLSSSITTLLDQLL
jgi:hypothetical protein